MKAPINAANKRTLTSDQLNDGQTVRSDAYVSIAEVQATKKKFYSHGYGTRSRMDGDNGFTYADLQGQDGSGSQVPINGKLRLVVFNSEDMEVPKTILDEYDLADLREAADESRSDRPVIPHKSPGAAEDEVVVWQVRAEEECDGYTVDAGASDFHVPYSEFRRTA